MDAINLTLSVRTVEIVLHAVRQMPWNIAHPAVLELEQQIKIAMAQAEPGDVSVTESGAQNE